MWTYRNPVRIEFGEGALSRLPQLVEGRSYVLITYPDPAFADLRKQVEALIGAPLQVVDDVAPNPDFERLTSQSARLSGPDRSPDIVLALGGGSVIDTAKVVAAAPGDFPAIRRFLETKEGADSFDPLPIVAVPTTAGTGSEVTCWGTVWDGSAGRKYSLELPRLYPEAAIVDPELMLNKPRALTVTTGLDALSHALESIWNRNANPISLSFAVHAAREILDILPALARDLANGELRARMARASLFAGLAFSNTRTAIAHAISYPITLHHGVPHGVACSFTLPLVMRSVAGVGGLCEEGLNAVFDTTVSAGSQRLDAVLRELRVSTDPADHGVAPDEFIALIGSAFDAERGQNFVGTLDALKDQLPEACHAVPIR